MLDIIDLILDLWAIGAAFRAMRRITDGEEHERGTALYDAPEMRRLRLIARVVVVLYLVAIIALPIAAIVYVMSDFWLSTIAGGYVVAALLIYVGLVWLGFWALKRIFRGKRQTIAAEIAPFIAR